MIFLWLLCAYGVTHIITGTKIFEWLRRIMDSVSPNFFGILFSCPACMGFWVGVILQAIIGNIITLEQNYYVLICLVHGAISSGWCWIVHILVSYVDEKTTYIQLQQELLINNPLDIAKQIISENAKP